MRNPESSADCSCEGCGLAASSSRPNEVPMVNTNNNTTKKVHRNVAVLKLPGPIALLILYVQGIVKAMTGNPTFPTPNPPLTALSGALGDLQVAETAALTRATGTIATRNEKRAALVTLRELLRGYVQSIADGTPENAIS